MGQFLYFRLNILFRLIFILSFKLSFGVNYIYYYLPKVDSSTIVIFPFIIYAMSDYS